MIRAAFALGAVLVASQAEAGRDVPPPRALHPVQPALVAAPPVLWGRSADRHVPVMADTEDDCADAEAGFDGDGDVPSLGDER